MCYQLKYNLFLKLVTKQHIFLRDIPIYFNNNKYMPSQVVRSCVPAYMEVMPLHIACNVKTRYPTRRHDCRWNTIIALYWPDWIIIMPSMKQQLDGYVHSYPTGIYQSVTYMEVYPFRLALGVTQGSVLNGTNKIYIYDAYRFPGYHHYEALIGQPLLCGWQITR